MGTLIDDAIGGIKEHYKEVVTYSVKLTPRQYYKLTILLDHIKLADEDGMANLLKHHPMNVNHDKLRVEEHSLGHTLVFDIVTDEEVEKMWHEEEYNN